MTCPRVADGGKPLNTLNKQPWTDDKGWSSSLGVGRGVNNPAP
jgi:hypothetical protein